MADGDAPRILIDTDEYTTTEETIYPHQAAEMLARRNTSNRGLQEYLVEKYATEHRDGRFYLTHQGLAFGPDGRIIDGQHRLAMIVMTKLPLRTQVTRYKTEKAAERAKKASDRGRSRTDADIEVLAGRLRREEAHDIIAIINAIRALSDSTVRAMPEQDREAMLDAYVDAARWARGALTSRTTASVRAAFAYAWLAYPEEVEEFASRVRAGTAQSGSALATWNRAVMDEKFATRGGSPERRKVTLRALRILKAHVQEEGDLSRLFTTDEGLVFFRARIESRKRGKKR